MREIMAKVASIQLSSGPNIQANLLEVGKYLEQISKTDSKLAVLPENFAMMPESDSEFLTNSETEGSGPIQDFISEKARIYKLWIIAGTIPIRTDNPKKVTSTTFVYNDKGEVVTRYDKVHLFDVELPNSDESYNESEVFQNGKDLKVVKTPIGVIGLSICYDLRFPELFRLQKSHNVEILVIPSAFTEQTGKVHWETLVKARAIENLCYVVTSCQDGYHISGRQTHGNSMIVNPWGQIMSRLSSGSGFIESEIDIKKLNSIREKFPVLEHINLIGKK
jgi:predicted amidohydrolase|tara:strand:- start:1484 stop:2317 length:834 start_codon:yes stop_codon:yes gene_type:complete